MLHLPIVVFFLSGAAALLFETLWFHQAGLALGNSVFASSLVLASFVGGLALGNGCVALAGARIRRPAAIYAGLELVIGLRITSRGSDSRTSGHSRRLSTSGTLCAERARSNALARSRVPG